MRISNPAYLEQAKSLSNEEQERVLSRMGGKLPRRLHKDKLSKEEAIAIQLEIEDEQLQEWREKMHAIKAATSKSSDKTKAKLKAVPEQAAPKTAPAKKTASKPAAKPVAVKAVATAEPAKAKPATTPTAKAKTLKSKPNK